MANKKSPFLDDLNFFKAEISLDGVNLVNVDLLKSRGMHKYIKRTGSPGQYRYWYKTPEGKIVEGKKPGESQTPATGKEEVGSRPGKPGQPMEKPGQTKPGVDAGKVATGNQGAVKTDGKTNLKKPDPDASAPEVKSAVESLKAGKGITPETAKALGVSDLQLAVYNKLPKESKADVHKKIISHFANKVGKVAGEAVKAGTGVSKDASGVAGAVGESVKPGATPKAPQQPGQPEGQPQEGAEKPRNELFFYPEEYEQTEISKEEVGKVKETFKKREKGKGERISIQDHKQLKAIISNTKFAFLSAGQNPEDTREKGMAPDDKYFKDRHEKLKSRLSEMGYVFSEEQGKYGNEEQSVLIMMHDANRNELLKLGEEMNQDTVIFSNRGKQNEMIHTTGKNKGQAKYKGENFDILPEADDFYTEFSFPGEKKKLRMSLKFDFDKQLTKALKFLADSLDLMKSILKRL